MGTASRSPAVQGFDITVTRVIKDLQSGSEIWREDFHTSYSGRGHHALRAEAGEGRVAISPPSPSPGG